MGQVVLLGIGIFDIADRTGDLRHIAGNAFIALGADAGGPVNGGVRTDIGLPGRADARQVGGEDEGGARTVRTMHDADGLARQVDAGVQLLDRRIVPAGDLALVDGGQGRRRPGSAGRA